MNWIKFTDRLPTKQDADHTGYIVVWHKTDGLFIESYRRLYTAEFTHWLEKVNLPQE